MLVLAFCLIFVNIKACLYDEMLDITSRAGCDSIE